MINFITHNKIIKAALITGCFFMCACENDVNEVREFGKRKASVEEGKNIDSYLSMDGKMRAHLTAPLLLRYDGDSGRKSEFPNSLHVDFYNDSAKVESQLRARYGRYLENENKVFLRDSVVAFNTKGDTLFCEELYWDQVLQKFYTDKKVILSKNYRRTLIVSKDGIRASQDLSSITFINIEPNSFVYVQDSTQSTTTVAPAPVVTKVDSVKKKP
jgi:hypothetical protein